MAIDNCRCPECGTEFNPRENCWKVCHDCFQLEYPEDNESHKARGECIKSLGSGCMQYTLEDAHRYQQRLIMQMRPEMGHKEIIGIMSSLEEGDEIMFKQNGYKEIFTEITITEVSDDAIKAEQDEARNKPWKLWVNNEGVPFSLKENHSDRQEILRLEVFEFHD